MVHIHFPAAAVIPGLSVFMDSYSADASEALIAHPPGMIGSASQRLARADLSLDAE